VSRPLELPRDSLPALGVKALLYAAALALYLLPLSGVPGIAASVAGAVCGMALAALAHRRRLRLAAALVLALSGLVVAWQLGEGALGADLVARLLGVRISFAVSEVITFGLGALALIFLLRLLSLARPPLALLEVVFVAGAAAVTFADHRNRMLNRPRFFSDWAWTLGVDPGTVLVGVGIAAALAAIFLFLRGQSLLKLATTLLLLLLAGGALFVLKEKRIDPKEPLDALNLSGKGQGSGSGSGSGSGGGGGGGGQSQNPFKDSYDSKTPPSPVAIAVLRDDFEPAGDLMYFRQQTLSTYNGHHLVVGTAEGWDGDLFAEFPRGGPLRAPPVQSAPEHVLVPTTMYLLVDHPQPLALSHAVRLAPAANPNPQQFVAAYDAQSLALAVTPQRLLGRRSIPAGWTPAQRAHYLALPDDPRYAALSDIIVRDVDPRFAEDDLARAWAIKRYLEREGYYTMSSTHASSSDPTASFLFGSLRGYCVHFAHAAVYLFRSQGIAARVALGYAVQTSKRSGGSSVLIMNDRAHAWPEIHLEGIGWVTFDVHPERTDVAPPSPVDYDLEKLLGELARSDKTAGVTAEGRPLQIPWRLVGLGLGLLVMALLVLAYLAKALRRLSPRLVGERDHARRLYLAVLDRLSDLGQPRLPGETRERHAERLRALAPSLEPLTRAHLRQALGGRAASREELARLARAVAGELRRNVPPLRRALAALNPIGWVRTR